ncbi:MAG: molybdenum cofactor biosynthesis protein MoeB [Epsilonproteobacteria bacterium]|nr:MAG: molybdenum cofactor biosynthesis protein MoeB [Campylobacterota bacterium]RLA66454.1 MAG: molybdenum cofactor biosynthesis protein MoeB [Campylobacterota bacterium]
MTFNEHEKKRYKRHLLLLEFGAKGQECLKNSKVLLVGLGGLGSPIALYLAAAGVGTLGLADFDKVDLSNLQRQVLFNEDDIGKSKATTAEKKLSKINSTIELKIILERLDASNIQNIIKDFDLVIDGSDNFATRFLVNDACVFLKRPFLHGSVHKFSGQIGLFLADEKAPCLRCLYPAPPTEGVGNCSEVGVLGTMTGMIGTLMASEAIKFLTSVGKNISGNLLVYNALETSLDKYSLARDESCPICSEHASIKNLRSETLVPSITREKIEKDFVIIDVRDKYEFEAFNIGGVHIPLYELESRLSELDKEKTIVALCQLGQRSMSACAILKQNNFNSVYHLEGGLDAQ